MSAPEPYRYLDEQYGGCFRPGDLSKRDKEEMTPLYTNPEGCTPTDIRVLRQANVDLAAESERLRAALRSVISHWNEFGPEFDFDRVVVLAERALKEAP